MSPVRKVLIDLGGRKFVAFLVLTVAVFLRAVGVDLDLGALQTAVAVYVGAEGVADVVSRFRSDG